MADLLLLLAGTVLVNNIVLSHYLGLTPFVGAGKRLQNAFALSAMTAVVLTAASLLNHLLYQHLLVPFDLAFLRTLGFMLIIATLSGVVVLAVRQKFPLLQERLGIFMPLLAGNSAILGVALLNSERTTSVVTALVFGLGAAAGFMLALILFAALRERLAVCDVPLPFQGSAISLITAGLMALAFMGFAGVV